MAKSLDDGIHTDVIYLDMAKAFDKVLHEKLLYKLEMVGVRDPLFAWFRSYLANKRHRTVIDGFASDWRYVPSGVPQGSIIGPLLFLIFINDIADDISTDTSIPLYADDAKCYGKLLDPVNQAILQFGLNTIVYWSELWGMSYNASKCKHFSLTKKQKPLETTNFLVHAGNVLRNMIEGVQRRATKLMVGSKLSYSDRLLKTGPMSLSSRRIYLDLLYLFKCQHGQYDLDVSGYLQFY